MNYPEFIESSACDALPSFHNLDTDVTPTQEGVSFVGYDHHSQIQRDHSQVFLKVAHKIIRSTYQQVEFGHKVRWGQTQWNQKYLSQQLHWPQEGGDRFTSLRLFHI